MRKISISIISLALIFMVGCTLPSTKMAQIGSFRVQAVKDGVHRDMFKALSRSNFEVAKLNLILAGERMKDGTNDAVIDTMVKEATDGMVELAKQRDFMVEWDRDYERSNALKAVLVDSKLFSEIGILNYIGETFSDNTKNTLTAWDEAKETWDAEIGK